MRSEDPCHKGLIISRTVASNNFIISSVFAVPLKQKITTFFRILVFNATFSNISAISWRPVLVVEEAGEPEENHRPWASNW